MYALLALFLISLIALSILVGRRVALLRRSALASDSGTPLAHHGFFFAPDIRGLKSVIWKNLRRHALVALVVLLRVYFRAANVVRAESEKVKVKITRFRQKNGKAAPAGAEKPESSKFLKMVSEYKNKIREIKDEVKEKENTK